jgi:hypothetical protein
MDTVDFWQQVAELLEPVPDHETRYRVYYDSTGQVLFYTMEDLPGNYLDIDRETYARADSKARVQNGKLVAAATRVSSKLVPDNQGQPCHPQNVAIVSDSDQNTKWKLKHYDRAS